MRVLASKPAGAVCIAALALALLGAADSAAAQPTEEQVALKASCRSDYMSYCWSVPHGGPEAAQCLKKNLAKLSPGCQQAVKAATAAAATPSAPAAEAKPAVEAKPATPPAGPAPSSAPAATAKATAPAPETAGQSQDAAPKAASSGSSGQSAPSAAAPAAKAAAPAPTSTAASKTAAPTPATQAAPAGAASVKEPSATQTTAPAEPAATTAAAPPSSSSPIGFIPPRKKLILVRNCRHDFKVFCPDVDLGGGRAISCLEDNKAQLTPDCRDALAKLTR